MNTKFNWKVLSFILIAVLIFSLAACVGTTVSQTEQNQQNSGVLAIVQNQPVPDLGGYSFPRQVVIETYEALNKTVSTWSYSMTIDGKIIELCPSFGYPIPGGTELTNPQQITAEHIDGLGWENGVLSNPEPNGLYPPSTSAGTLVECVNSDGTVSPMYFEPDVFALPYRIHSDIQLTRVDNSTPSIVITPKTKP